MRDYYWVPVPGQQAGETLPGKLIAVEGTDGVGRSTQMRLLRNWLEASGLAAYDTGFTRGRLAGAHIQEAKDGHTMGSRTQTLYYATDFADRLEREILPALRAGYVVLTDRYIYSLMARAAVRGMERPWLRKLYGFALQPDLVLYMKVSVEKLIPRVLTSGGFDYWESGMDYLREPTMCDAFRRHQSALLREFDQMSQEFGFTVVDANRDCKAVFGEIQQHVQKLVAEMTPGEVPFTTFVPEMLVRPQEPEERRNLVETMRDFFTSLLEDGA